MWGDYTNTYDFKQKRTIFEYNNKKLRKRTMYSPKRTMLTLIEQKRTMLTLIEQKRTMLTLIEQKRTMLTQ